MAVKKFRWWAFWRRFQYASGFFLIWGMIGTLVYFVNFYEPANCFDNVMNNGETGIDCGGGCVRICAADVIPPRVVWAESFEITKGQYNVVGYIENNNQIAATPELRYTFSMYNGSDLVWEESGQTILPPNSVYPVFEGRVFTPEQQAVTETRLTLEPAEMWLPASVGRDQFRSIDIELVSADSRPELNVEFENTELLEARDIEVVATIFDEVGTPVTASQTFVPQISARSTRDLTFTWPQPIAKTVRSCIIPTDVVLGIDLSGSMNNDSDNPPQPLTDALEAASIFVNSLKEEDQVGVVTFATRASITNELTSNNGPVANQVIGLEIEPAEEVGFTNTPAALLQAQEELNSARHNEDARRVLVLLTDGLPTEPGDDDSAIRQQAEETALALNEDGIEVYAIGLGQDVDAEFVRALASSNATAYFAPNSADLQRIYAEITSSLCESGPTKIDVIAKTQANFAELR